MTHARMKCNEKLLLEYRTKRYAILLSGRSGVRITSGTPKSAGNLRKIKGFRRFFIFIGKEKNREIHRFSLANSTSANGNALSANGTKQRAKFFIRTGAVVILLICSFRSGQAEIANYFNVLGKGIVESGDGNLILFKIKKKPQRVYFGDWGDFKNMQIYWKDDECLVINSVEYGIE